MKRAVLHIGDLEIHPEEGLVRVAERVVPLSARELALLTALATRPDRIVRREDLCRIVWGTRLRPGDRSIDVYVHKLRSKLEAAVPGRSFIHTHVGFGYRLASEVSHPFHNQATSP